MPSVTTQPAAVRLGRLTSLRFFAASAAVTAHVSLLTHHVSLERTAARGAVSVTFFFMLSGFVLTWSHRPADRPATFWRRRFARVYPLHVTLWAVSIAVAYWALGEHVRLLPSLMALFLVQSWVPHSTYYFAADAVAWSLSCDAFLYLCFPFLLRVLRSRTPRRRWQIAGVAAALTVASSFTTFVFSAPTAAWFVTFSPIGAVPVFVIGMILGLQMKDGWRPAFGIRTVWTLLALGMAVAFALPEPWWRVFPVVLPFVAAIAVAADRDISGRPGYLNHPVLVRLGVWSFALYLCHPPLLLFVASRVPTLSLAQSVALGFGIAVVSLGLAGVLHERLEAPLEAVLRGGPARAEIDGESVAKHPMAITDEVEAGVEPHSHEFG